MFSDDSDDIFSQEFDDGEGFSVFFDLFNEQHSGGTSLFVDFLSFSDQFSSSVSDPDQVFSGFVDFVIQVFF